MGNLVVANEGIATRCPEGHKDPSVLFFDMPYVTASGDTIYITAYLEDMDEPKAVETKVEETKGAPVTSSLLGTYGDYNNFITRVYPASGTSCYVSKKNELGDDTNTMSDVTVSYSSGKWSFDKQYYWPSNASDNLYFVSVAPKSAWTDGHITDHNVAASWDASTHKYSFTYKSIVDTPSGKVNGEEQNDLLVAYNKQSKNSYDSNVHIDFKHACVGVRFIMGNIFGNIEALKLENFYKDATVTVGESSLEFSNHANLVSFYQNFDFETSTHSDLDPLDETTNKVKTFMILPQKLIDRGTDIPDADMVIIMEGSIHPETLSFKNLADTTKGGDAKLADWSSYAGKMITFRISSIKANNVTVSITDDVNGLTKENIVIKNVGKSPIFIRMKIVGNWLNEDGEVLSSWNESNPFGLFDGKNPVTDATAFPRTLPSNWSLGSDGFYYYKKFLETNDVVTQNLFNSFTVNSKPVDATGTWAQGGTKMEIKTLEMALMVQAIIAETNLNSFQAAWGTEMVSWIGTPVRDN